MKTLLCLLSVGLLTVVSAAARGAIERSVQKTFTVQPGGTVHVDTQGGDVRVMPGEGNEVRVVARQKIRASTEAEADALLQKLALTMSQTGNDVTLSAKYPERKGISIFGVWPPVRVSFDLVVPTRFSANLNTSGGDIVIGNLTGEIRAKTSGGDVAVGQIEGTVNVRTSGGDITLASSTGPATLDTAGGDIQVGRVVGAADLSTSGGDIAADEVVGGLRAHTSGGDITARLSGPLSTDCGLSTSGGDIEVTVDSAVALTFDASTSGGEVETTGLALDITRGGNGKHKLVGTAHGGGPLLKLRSSGGDIEVKSR